MWTRKRGLVGLSGMRRGVSGLSGLSVRLHCRRHAMLLWPPRIQRLVLRLLGACLAVALVVVTRPATAAALSVPMCGPLAETIAAPPSGRPVRETELRASCDPQSELSVHRDAPRRAPERTAEPDSVPRLPPVVYRLPPVPSDAERLVVVKKGGARPGFRRGIERPPRGG